MSAARIERAWSHYRKTLLPADASEVQVAETRKAFFSGAAVLFFSLLEALSDGADDTPEDLALMSEINEELQTFGAELDLEVLGGKLHG